MRQPIEIIGAGEGNRTLVISLEGVGTLCDFTAHSDKSAPFGPFESKRVFGAVRMAAVLLPSPALDRQIAERAGCPLEVVPAAINRPLTRGRSALESVCSGWFTLRRR